MALKQYDPKRVALTFKGILIQGFASGTFVNVERNEDTFSLETGADGNSTRVRSQNRSGKMTITLRAEAPTNDLLSAVALLDERTGLGVGAWTLKNANSTTRVHAQSAWITKPASVEHASEASTREWVFESDNIEMSIGGAIL